MTNPYLGHPSQLSGVEISRLVGGKGDGMTLMNVRNGLGLELTVSLDRASDISRASLDGVNLGYFAPCGYVHPSYYDKDGAGFLKSFTAGFFTTCGLTAVGSPCTDEGEELGLHGTLSNTPCEKYAYDETDDAIVIRTTVRDAALFGRQLLLERRYTVSKKENAVYLTDTVTNIGDAVSPYMLLYHCNMGYPLLSENAVVTIDSLSVTPRNAHAAEDTANCLNMEKPQSGYEERCYYHDIRADKDGYAEASIFNPDIRKGVTIRFDKSTLDRFCEWKMMGRHEYVLGLEPGNCTPDGRDVLRKNGTLKFLAPEQSAITKVEFHFKRK